MCTTIRIHQVRIPYISLADNVLDTFSEEWALNCTLFSSMAFWCLDFPVTQSCSFMTLNYDVSTIRLHQVMKESCILTFGRLGCSWHILTWISLKIGHSSLPWPLMPTFLVARSYSHVQQLNYESCNYEHSSEGEDILHVYTYPCRWSLLDIFSYEA